MKVHKNVHGAIFRGSLTSSYACTAGELLTWQTAPNMSYWEFSLWIWDPVWDIFQGTN